MNSDYFSPFMLHALELAKKGRWKTYPNPVVGAVLVQENNIVAEGWHHGYGQNHAEVECILDARAKGVDPSLCTLVVTLEPCNHQGKTPPCTDAIINAGIKHVVIGMRDPTEKAGGGIEKLQKHNIKIDYPVEEKACFDAVADFYCWQVKKRPYLILKLASTLDGCIATRAGHSKWISCEESRNTVHELRNNVALSGGASLIGGLTFRNDNPRLTTRLKQENSKSPISCIITSRLPADSDNYNLLKDRPHETVFFTSPAVAASPSSARLQKSGVRIVSMQPISMQTSNSNILDMNNVLEYLYTELKCPYVLCEGGAITALSLLEKGLVDEFRLHISPYIFGDDEARHLFKGHSPSYIDEAIKMRTISTKICGDDVHITLKPL